MLLIELGIDVIYSAVAHPQTQGKVERFHGALDRALRRRGVPATRAAMGRELARFRSEYNDVRPHESLGMAVPAERYQISPRPYRARPPAAIRDCASPPPVPPSTRGGQHRPLDAPRLP